MRTVRDFIKSRDIPADVKQKALAEYDFIKAGGSEVIDFHENANSLIRAFSWMDSPSGHGFWERISQAEVIPLDSPIAHHYTGKDCCGILYWSNDGGILCNECGAEFELQEKARKKWA